MLPATFAAPASGRRCERELRRRTTRRRDAFTMVELTVVLLVISVLAAAAAPTFYRSLVHHRLESAARRVKQDLEYLRDAARGKSTTLACEFSGTSYTLDDPSIEHLDHGGAYTVDLAAAPYELSSVAADFDGETSIGFDGYGAATADGEIVLALGDGTRTITVESSTSQITIFNP